MKHDLAGERFGRWTVERYAGTSKHQTALWLCRCDCGEERVITANSLRCGLSKSCGCLRREIVPYNALTTHGMSGTPEYYIWRAAQQRCKNPNNKDFSYYGGRGIEFRFKSFEEFINELGSRPSDEHSIDRIDNDDHYRPGNVRWATRSDQNKNRRPFKAREAAV